MTTVVEGLLSGLVLGGRGHAGDVACLGAGQTKGVLGAECSLPCVLQPDVLLAL